MELFVTRTWMLCLCLFATVAFAPQATEARNVPVTVVTDSVFEQLPQWRGIIKSAFRKALEDFPEMSGGKPVIQDWKTYDPEGHETYSGALEEIAVETEFHKGVLIYFAGRCARAALY